ncbi:SigB/SigF/SigG family RNA polymerase sigma factor [Nocardia tengchongensis]|uniref:SigB/SigF/SigG family RNA polymerase sigma factor n=1 Tax=Nocardia tengchongensis TaxID=2055889 RepID=UPI00369E71D0
MYTGIQVPECMGAGIADQSIRRRAGRGGERYDDVEPLLAELTEYAIGDARRTALRQQVIERCLPVAEHIARRFGGRGEDYEDLLQTARVALINAVDRFDSDRGTTFLAFAVPTITGEVRRHFRDYTWAVRVPRRVKETQQLLGPATEALTQRLARPPKAGEIAAELGVDLADVVQAVVAGNAYQTTSIDAATENDDNVSRPVLRFLVAEEPGYLLVDDCLAVKPLFVTLSDRERQILAWRFFESQTQLQIARQLGISQIQVSRILSRTLEGLRERASRD